MRGKLHFERKPLIVVEALSFREWKERLFAIIEQFGWQPFDLSLSNFHIPTNPIPEGAIISSPLNSPRSPLKGRRLGVPTVYIGRHIGINNYGDTPAVLLDSIKAGEMAVDHLCEKGFRNILIFTQNEWESVSMSLKGARQRAEELDLTFHVHRLQRHKGESDDEKQIRWVKERGDVIKSLPKPLACLTTSDHTAAKLCFDCQGYDLSVPEDIAIISTGNLESVCNSSIVPISSVDLNWELAFQSAGETLKKILSGEPVESTPVLIPPKVAVTRRSTDILAVQEPRVAKAVRFMWDQLSVPLTVEDIADEVGLTSRTLTRLFKKYLDRGVKEELNRKRLERAAELLVTTDLPVSTISKTVGYPSQTYFHRTFLRTHNVTPGDYRSQNSRH